MEKQSQDPSALIQAAALKIELIEGLQRAISRKYRRLLGTARADWERLFAVKDSSEALVKLEVRPVGTEPQTKGSPGFGFLKSQKQTRGAGVEKRHLPGFAH